MSSCVCSALHWNLWGDWFISRKVSHCPQGIYYLVTQIINIMEQRWINKKKKSKWSTGCQRNSEGDAVAMDLNTGCHGQDVFMDREVGLCLWRLNRNQPKAGGRLLQVDKWKETKFDIFVQLWGYGPDQRELVSKFNVSNWWHWSQLGIFYLTPMTVVSPLLLGDLTVAI